MHMRSMRMASRLARMGLGDRGARRGPVVCGPVARGRAGVRHAQRPRSVAGRGRRPLACGRVMPRLLRRMRPWKRQRRAVAAQRGVPARGQTPEPEA